MDRYRNPSLNKWEVLKSVEIERYRIFSLKEVENRSPDSGKQGNFYVLDFPDWINVIPLTTNNEVVMVEQYRHGLDDITLEIPGGCVDPEDPSPLFAAQRELTEETGYSSDDWVEIGVNSPNPAINSNHCYSYLCRNTKLTQAQQLDGMEEIAVHLVPLDEIPELIQQKKIVHSLVITAFYFLDQHEK